MTGFSPDVLSLPPLLAALVFAPLLSGIINKVKAFFGGRTGRPLLQLYFDLFKLLRKGAVISRTTGGIFVAGPAIYLATAFLALLVAPCGQSVTPLCFVGDFILLVTLLGLGRFALILAALDTGSSFEGMGASREAAFSALAEPIFFICFLALGKGTEEWTTLFLLKNASIQIYSLARPELLLVPPAFFLLLLVENSRIPVDDPNTHLELTMIHEAMILDHSGPDLAFILYGSSLKLWLFGLLAADILIPFLPDKGATAFFLTVACVFGIAALAGILESCTARLRMQRVPQFLALAGMLAGPALIITLFRP
jgi:formate hydrogenlyase subunit 4